MVFFNSSSREVMTLKPNSFSALLVFNILLGCPSGLSGLFSFFGPSEIGFTFHGINLFGFSGLFSLSGLFGLFSFFGLSGFSCC